MKFIKNNHINKRFVDNVFSVTTVEKKDTNPDKINATVGVLKDDNHNIITYDVVKKVEEQLTANQKNAYAGGIEGNPTYLEAAKKFVLENRIKNVKAVATAGGTGAISLAVSMCMNENDTILIPSVCWGNYKTIAEENNLNVMSYDVYDLNDMFEKIDSVDRVFLMINSPCENPLGHSYSYDEWKKIIDKLNSCDKEAILLNDTAYIDYSLTDGFKDYFELFNNLNDNVMVCIGASMSKSFSLYGYRLGCLFITQNNKEELDLTANLFAKHARSIWSSCNNSAMNIVTEVVNNHLDEYKKELEVNRNILKERIRTMKDCLNENAISYYDFSEGFFVTLKNEDDSLHQRLMDNHIYTIKVNKGLRIGICSMNLKEIRDFTERYKVIVNIK